PKGDLATKASQRALRRARVISSRVSFKGPTPALFSHFGRYFGWLIGPKRSRILSSPMLCAGLKRIRCRLSALAIVPALLLAGSVVAAPPPNDTCAGAVVIPANGPFPFLTGIINVTNATTTGDPVPPSGFDATNLSRSVWFSFRPSATADYTFSVNADTFTT